MKLSEQFDSIKPAIQKTTTLVAEKINDLRSYSESLSQKMDVSIHKEFGPLQREIISSIFRDAAQDFYDSYSPSIYDRTYSLYGMFKPTIGEYGEVEYDGPPYDDLYDDSVPKGREGNSLFDLVVYGGFHGGAVGTDKHGVSVSVPTYRVPPWFTGRNGELVGYWAWGGVAEHSTPPYQIIHDKLSSAEGGEIFDTFKQIADRHNEEFVASVNNKFKQLFTH